MKRLLRAVIRNSVTTLGFTENKRAVIEKAEKCYKKLMKKCADRKRFTTANIKPQFFLKWRTICEAATSK